MLRGRFRDASIRTKLSVLLVCVVGSVLLLCCTFFAVREIRYARMSLDQRMTTLASVLGENCQVALRFLNPDDAIEVLSSLQLQQAIVAARVYDSDGKSFASYSSEASQLPESKPAYEGKHEDGPFVDIHLAIDHEGEELGSILLRASLDEVYAQQSEIIRVATTALVLFLGLSYLLAWRLQRVVTEPIDRLVSAAKVVARDENYAVRVERRSDDEIGELTTAFNSMLEQIDNHRNHLEELIRQRTQLLEAKTQEAMAANVAKSEFLANMSHEIRTPMTAILGFADVLLHDPDVAKAMPQRLIDLRTIQRNGEHLVTIINDILDISKIEAGKFEVDNVEFSPWQTLCGVASLMRVRADAKGLKLYLRADGPIPTKIRSDPTRLRQILINLIGNAIKFTEVGEVRVKVAYIDQPDAPKLRFRVMDTGIGMTSEQIGRLFQPFSQADSTMARSHGGTGLGLAISKRLTQLLGGNIEVETQPSLGATFTATIAIDKVEDSGWTVPRETLCQSSETPANVTPNRELRCRILLAEDGPDNQRLISFYLKKQGASVTVAQNGQLAIDAIIEAENAGTPFDLVLMDMQMPVLDGYSATTKLREQGYRIPIIALTAHAMAHDRKKCLDAGCDDYVSKPINRDILINIILQHLVASSSHH